MNDKTLSRDTTTMTDSISTFPSAGHISLAQIALGTCILLSIPLICFRGIGVFDDSVYLKIGELILDGKLPYRDVFDNKPPAIYYLAALIAFIGNRHWLAPRVFLLVFFALTGHVVNRYTTRHWGSRAAALAVLSFGLSYLIAQGYSYHTEQFSAGCGFCAVIALSGVRVHERKSWLLAGLMLGLATLFKQTGVLYLVSVLLFLSLQPFLSGQDGAKHQLRRLLCLLFGYAILPTIAVAVNAWQGTLQVFFDCVVLGVLALTANKSSIIDALFLACRVPAIGGSLFVAVLFVSRGFRKRFAQLQSKNEILLLTLFGTISLYPLLKTNSNPHYAGMSVVFLSIVQGILLDVWLTYLSDSGKWLLYRLTQLTLATVFSVFLLAISYGGITFVSDNRLASDLAQMYDIRRVLDQGLAASEPILVISDAPARLYYLSGRMPAIRHLYYYGSGWLDPSIPSKEEAFALLTSTNIPGAILETPESEGEGGSLSDEVLTKYGVTDMASKYNPLRKTFTHVLMKK